MDPNKLNEGIEKYADFKGSADELRAVLAAAGYTTDEQQALIDALAAEPNEDVPPPMYDKFVVRANRVKQDDGSTKVVSLLVVSKEPSISLTEAGAADLNAYEIHHFGARYYPAGQHNVGDTITL